MSSAIESQSTPRISIVTPCLNQGCYLEATLRSVLDQNYPNLEYIVMDGGSTDGTSEILRRYQERLHYWQSLPDKGQYQAINSGFQKATGDIFCWLNGDDQLLPGALQAVASIFAQLPEVEWLSSLFPVTMDGCGSLIGTQKLSGFSKQAFLDGAYIQGGGAHFFGFIQQESTFWRRSLWERAGPLDVHYGVAADFDLWSRFFRHVDCLYGAATLLGCFRFVDGQRSDALRERYLAQGLESLQSLRRDLGWKEDPVRKMAYKLGAVNFPILPFSWGWPLSRRVQSSYEYCSHDIVRRQRGASQQFWEVRHSRFHRWNLDEWAPNYVD